MRMDLRWLRRRLDRCNDISSSPLENWAPLVLSNIFCHIQLSSPSKTPGMPTKSKGIPSSASASIFNGCSLIRREAKPGVVYCPLARPVFGMSSSFGGLGGGGSAFEYRILAMKSWW